MERPVIRKRRRGLFIDCSQEKVLQVERMCKRVNYEDMMFIVEAIGNVPTRFGFKFGNGLMGKNAEIRKLTPGIVWEGEDGILIIANIGIKTIAHETCYIRNTKEKGGVINLGGADFISEGTYMEKKIGVIGIALLGPGEVQL
jgi:hypothetical protein